VLRTEVGYAGGTTSDPTYHDLGSHAEVVQISFDPDQIGYGDLLELYWQGHDPTRSSRGSQYRSILLCEDSAELDEARASAQRQEVKLGRKIQSELVVGKPFYPAEDYHQKWKLRQRRELFSDLAKSYANEAELLRSFAATKLNAFAGGHLSKSQLDELGDALHLSPTGLSLVGLSRPPMQDASTGSR
jgi:peptide-methionine (S)-S-oxide reductase